MEDRSVFMCLLGAFLMELGSHCAPQLGRHSARHDEGFALGWWGFGNSTLPLSSAWQDEVTVMMAVFHTIGLIADLAAVLSFPFQTHNVHSDVHRYHVHDSEDEHQQWQSTFTWAYISVVFKVLAFMTQLYGGITYLAVSCALSLGSVCLSFVGVVDVALPSLREYGPRPRNTKQEKLGKPRRKGDLL